MGGQDARHSGHDTAVHDHRHSLLPGEFVEREGILGKERDVHDVLPCFDQRAQYLEAHVPGHGTDHEIAFGDQRLHL